MTKSYRCADCGAVCLKPIYLRLQLTRCGLMNAKPQARHRSFRLGHYCQECLSSRVLSITRREELPTDLTPFLVS